MNVQKSLFAINYLITAVCEECEKKDCFVFFIFLKWINLLF